MYYFIHTPNIKFHILPQGVMGCSWCKTNGSSSDAICASQTACSSFNEGGTYSALVSAQAALAAEQQKLPELNKMHRLSVSVGPIAAIVLTAFLVLLTIYCYKAKNSSLSCVEDSEEGGLTTGIEIRIGPDNSFF